MILAVDVDYHDDDTAMVAAVLFTKWNANSTKAVYTTTITKVKPYEPGSFYQREMPCILEVLKLVKEPVDTIVVDGYVWLDENERPGLGAHLFLEMERKIPIVGVAKSRFQGADHALAILRGQSKQPLFVTTVGIDPHHAADCVRSMSGDHRFPTILKFVDHLCRGRNVRLSQKGKFIETKPKGICFRVVDPLGRRCERPDGHNGPCSSKALAKDNG